MSTPPAYNIDPHHFLSQHSVPNDSEEAPPINPISASEHASIKLNSTSNEGDLQQLREREGKVPCPAYMLAFLETVSSVAISGAGIIGAYSLLNISHL